MRHISKQSKELIRRIFIYAGMVLTVVASVILVTFLVLGFRLNLGNGEIEQYAFLRFSSIPSGAVVTIDGSRVSNSTPNKASVEPGQHAIVMQKNDYEPWSKNIDIAAGTLKWLNYILFVPKTLTVEPVADYPEIYASVSSPKGRSILIQPRADTPAFDIVEIGSDNIKTTSIAVPSTVYSADSGLVGALNTFDVQGWDEGGRYLLVKHSYADKIEWLLIDTQYVNLSKNITRIFDIQISSIDFAGPSGNYFFVIESGDIRKLDLSLSTISRTLVSNVSSMSIYESNIVAYSGKDETGNQIIGLYRDGDETPYTVKSLIDVTAVPTRVATFHYFNEDYLAYSVGRNINILGGKYPSVSTDSESSMKPVASFDVDSDIVDFGFSPNGEFLLVRTSTAFYSYDLEYQLLSSSAVGCSGVKQSLGWLNNNYLWSTCDGSLIIRESDGQNSHTINAVSTGHSVVLTRNGKYLYSVGKTDVGYQLQRVRMILP